VLGCQIDRLDLGQSVAVCEEAIATRSYAQHMSINVAKLMALRTDGDLRAGVEDAELVTADGQPIVWASRLLRDPLPCRVAGIDLMNALIGVAAEKGYRLFILGATREVLDVAVRRLEARHPGIRIVGHRDGYYAEAEEDDVAREIAASKADILFVAMSSPRKEYFLARYRHQMGVPFVMGVGGAIDVCAGMVKRAPRVMQRIGLEWLYRLWQEPRRLGKRYLQTNTSFLWLLAIEILKHRLHWGGSRPSSGVDEASLARRGEVDSDEERRREHPAIASG
jgi:N-acetylglucosaminyldiphosphoundecaprenol N-acetyl-beta-D-mannosaminyltransferase